MPGQAIPMPQPGDTETEKAERRQNDKAERLEHERDAEREEGIAAKRRGSSAAPSDRPENEPPHPQDVNDIGDEG